ncbi:hypothetical protein CLPUN_02750 [Clostridium puniceum]|uniref:DUF4358 domain-containing protein n=1 Tax=Clostridium puniceum TaxID=29367 RepID=A0A1S8TX27_9CLOT|nr:DUF4358 domain-containing protein [Clostridium puniceum]OOM82353.1 hypothetical protein CLPUN_02750 [Clostridium puniceum]
MIKKFSIAVFLVIFILGVIGCSSKSDISFKDISEKIEKTVDISNMRVEDKEKLKKLYDIDADKLEDFKFYRAESNIKADEILILKVEDKNAIEDINSKIKKRIEKQEGSFKDYLPKEYDLTKNNVLKTKGNFILFAVLKDADKVQASFDESLK